MLELGEFVYFIIESLTHILIFRGLITLTLEDVVFMLRINIIYPLIGFFIISSIVFIINNSNDENYTDLTSSKDVIRKLIKEELYNKKITEELKEELAEKGLNKEELTQEEFDNKLCHKKKTDKMITLFF